MSQYTSLSFRKILFILSLVFLVVPGIIQGEGQVYPVSADTYAQVGNLLYSQVSTHSVHARSSSDLNASLPETMAADDFVVPGSGWVVQSVSAQGRGGATNAPFDVIFWTDNAGLPGTAVCTRPDETNTGTTEDPIIVLSTPCALVPGTYWVSIQHQSSNLVGWFWQNNIAGTFNSPAVWQAPGNTAGCVTSWTPLDGTLGCFDSQDPADRQFELYGLVATELAVDATCNGDNLEVSIISGEGPFNILAATSHPQLPLNGVGIGTHILNGPDVWNTVIVSETSGDTEAIGLGNFTCVDFDGTIIIPGGAPGTTMGSSTPYPDTRLINGLGTTITDVNVTITGLGHTFPGDVEILLVSPQGTAVQVMGDACADWGGSVYEFTFDDEAASQLMAANGCNSGTFQPSTLDSPSFPSPAPPGPYATSLSAFDGEDPNGTWSLYVNDDTSGNYGDLASWSLDIAAITPTDTPASPITLVATAICVDENLAVTILAGDGPFNITASGGGNTPVNGVSVGTTTINGPDKWDNLTVSETSGDTESSNLGQFKCRTDERPVPISPPHRSRTTDPFPTFAWTPVSFANNYRVFVFDDKVAASRTVDIRQNSGGPTTMQLSTPLPDRRLFWRVRGRTNRVWGLWSIRFTLFKDPVAPLTVSTPVPTSRDDAPAPTPIPTVGPAPTFPPPPNSR
jgi:hypothetical protein